MTDDLGPAPAAASAASRVARRRAARPAPTAGRDAFGPAARRAAACAVTVVAALTACSAEGRSVTQRAEAAEGTGPALSELVPTPGRQSPGLEASRQLDSTRTTAIVRAAGRVAPAVVSVHVLRRETARARTRYELFFMPPGRERQSASFGSGVIVRADGIVLTNEHVVRGADQIRVTLPGGRDLEAELVGADPVADIAVLRARATGLPVAPIGTVEGLMIGEWALAIGNPLGNYAADAEPTVTAGVVSAVGRNIVPASEESGFYLGMIQTDASINPGNSGGPLVNAAGEVIGINASILSRGGGSEGLGFAIPIDRALRIADELLAHREVRRPWLGLDVEPVEADAWGRTRGVRVARVAPGSPADRAALEAGDRLVSAGGRDLTGPLDFEAMLLDLRVGERIELAVEGQPRPVTVEAGPVPSVTAERVTVLQDIQLITVTPQIRAERRLASEDGALIAAIPDELSGRLGLRAGDVIVQINRVRVRSAEELARIFDGLRGSGTLRIWFERDGAYLSRDLYWR